MISLMGIAAAAAAAGFGVLFSLYLQSRPPSKSAAMSLALERYVDGDRVLASRLAQRVEIAPDDPDEAEWASLRDFLIGAGRVAEAEETGAGSEQRELLYDAIAPLEAASARGFPPGRRAEGHRLLGDSLYRLGRFRDAVAPYRSAIEIDRTLDRQIAPRLARSLLRSGAPEKAFETIEAYRKDLSLTPSQRRQAELTRIEALMALGRWDEAADVIEATSEAAGPSPESVSADEAAAERQAFRERLRLLHAELAIDRAFGQPGGPARWPLLTAPAEPTRGPEGPDPAMLDTIERGLESLRREAGEDVAARARMLNARLHFLRGEPDRALGELMQVRQQRPFAGEAIAAGLTEIEMLIDRSLGGEAVQAARYLVSELGNPRRYDGSLVPFSEFERRLIDAVETLQREGDFSSAIDIARAFPPVFGATEALLQEGAAYRAWADQTLDRQRRSRRDVAAAVAELARDRYRAAGDAFAAAAELEFTSPRYVPTLWAAIDAYQKAKHFRRSLTLLEPYLRYERRQRKPRGLLASGRAWLAEGTDEACRRAVDILTECVTEFPRDPLRYEARLVAAQASAEIGDLDRARDMLQENLRDGQLAPSSPVWRDSLFTLGELLYQRVHENRLLADHAVEAERRRLMAESREVIDEALRVLDEAVTRYWDGSDLPTPPRRSLHAAYLSARTHRIAAQIPIIEAEGPDTTTLDRRRSRLAAANELRAALDRYVGLRNHLEQRLDEQGNDARLPSYELALLRNCLIGEADTLFELERLDEAAAAYGSVTLRYMNEPLALEGILGHAQCLRRLGRQREADSRIRQASLVLRRIPDEWNGRFEEITRYSRGEWDRLLQWMNGRIANPEV